MPKPKGTPKTPGSGRRAGTPNRKTLELKELAEKHGVDPFEILLLFAKGDWKALGYKSETITKFTRSGDTVEVPVISPDHRLEAAAEACQYLHPKRKAIEHSGLPRGPLDEYLAMTPEERQRRLQEIQKRLGKK